MFGKMISKYSFSMMLVFCCLMSLFIAEPAHSDTNVELKRGTATESYGEKVRLVLSVSDVYWKPGGDISILVEVKNISKEDIFMKIQMIFELLKADVPQEELRNRLYLETVLSKGTKVPTEDDVLRSVLDWSYWSPVDLLDGYIDKKVVEEIKTQDPNRSAFSRLRYPVPERIVELKKGEKKEFVFDIKDTKWEKWMSSSLVFRDMFEYIPVGSYKLYAYWDGKDKNGSPVRVRSNNIVVKLRGYQVVE